MGGGFEKLTQGKEGQGKSYLNELNLFISLSLPVTPPSLVNIPRLCPSLLVPGPHLLGCRSCCGPCGRGLSVSLWFAREFANSACLCVANR